MSRTLKVRGNHVMMYDHNACFLRVVKFARFVLFAVSEEAKTWLPSLLRWPSKTSNNLLKTRTHKHKKVDESGKGAVYWLRKREKTERTWGKERVGTNFENILCLREKEKIRSMYKKTITRFGFCDIQNNQGLGKGYQPQPSASAHNPYLHLSQKPHPVIVYYMYTFT